MKKQKTTVQYIIGKKHVGRPWQEWEGPFTGQRRAEKEFLRFSDEPCFALFVVETTMLEQGKKK